MLQIDQLKADDLPAALKLSLQAGWNQTAQNWARLLILWPSTCLAGRVNGELVATVTLSLYPPATGWVGMVLVETNHQNKGYGGAMLDAVIRQADVSGVKTLGLDATDQGRSIYLKRGFEDQMPIDRWVGKTSPNPSAPNLARLLEDRDWPAIEQLDRAANGFDRTALLRQMHRETPQWFRVIGNVGEVKAYGLCRTGQQSYYVGPIVAETPQQAAALSDALIADLHAVAPGAKVMIDVRESSGMDDYLLARQFRPGRRLMRMLRVISAPSPTCLEINRAICGFELS